MLSIPATVTIVTGKAEDNMDDDRSVAHGEDGIKVLVEVNVK